VTAPMKEEAKKPAGLKQDSLGCCRTAWARARRSTAATRAARRGVHSRASLKAADGNYLILRPNSDGEGVGATVQDRVGSVVDVPYHGGGRRK
jgi:hypothetical protein